MKRALLVATGLLAISTTTASAGVFVGLAVGTEPGMNDEMKTLATPSGRSLRGMGGYRFGNASVEGAINGFGVLTGRGEQTMYQASAAFRFNLPIGNEFEGFGRAGLERTSLSFGDERYDLSGNGFLIGGGFEYRLNAILANASLFVDYTIHHANLQDARNNKVGETSRVWAVGFTIGM
jgi:hypothetical protein